MNSPADQQLSAWLQRDAVDCLPEGELERRLALGRPLRVKLGIDPTAPDIHLGFTVVLQKLREFQDDGEAQVDVWRRWVDSELHLGFTVVLQKLREFQDDGEA